MTEFQSYQATPDQIKYLTYTIAATRTFTFTLSDGTPGSEQDQTTTGSVTVNAQSGERTHDLVTTEDFYYPQTGSGWWGGAPAIIHYRHVVGGAGYVVDVDTGATTNYASGMTTTIDDSLGGDFTACGMIISFGALGSTDGGTLLDQIAQWNSTFPPQFPAVTDLNSYSSSQTTTFSDGIGTRTIAMTVAWTRTGTTFTWNYQYSETATDHVNERIMSWSGTATLSNPNTAGNVYSDMVSLLLNWPLNDDALYPWRTDAYQTMAPKMSRLEVQTNVSPVGFIPALMNDYTSPIADSLGRNPFTTADSSSVPPGWTVNSGNVDNNGNSPTDPGYDITMTYWTPTWSPAAWKDTTDVGNGVWQYQYPAGKTNANSAATALIQMLDGSIQGVPNPAGYQNYFRYDFQDIRGCCGSSLYMGYLYGYGYSLDGWNGQVGSGLPRNSTQWCNTAEIINKPQFGALLAYADTFTVPAGSPTDDPTCSVGTMTTDGAFWAVKWAECGETYQSINFARPGGKDKFAFDESQSVYCYAGGVLNTPDGSPATGLTLAGTWGGSCVGGFFTGCTTDGSGNLTLGTKVFSVPSDWADANGDSSAAFGQLRFPTAPSILGRAAATASGTTITFAGAQTSFGMAVSGTEQVDIYDAAMTSLASNVTATRTSDTTFTTASAYATAAFVMIHGAPAYQYCDDYPKGDYIYLEWLLDFRTNGEAARMAGLTDCSGNTPPTGTPATNFGFATFSQTQDALPILKCSPRVACFSPNGETWPNGKTYPFPTTFILDERYGSKWQAQVLWSITDPLWQAPHTPCNLGDGAAWVEDGNGSCPADTDTDKYYALAPMVEARLTVPAGFPALPSGITLGFLSPVSYNSGDVAYPPAPPGFLSDGNPATSPIPPPWFVAANLCDSINGACRFNYADWVVGCPPT